MLRLQSQKPSVYLLSHSFSSGGVHARPGSRQLHPGHLIQDFGDFALERLVLPLDVFHIAVETVNKHGECVQQWTIEKSEN